MDAYHRVLGSERHICPFQCDEPPQGWEAVNLVVMHSSHPPVWQVVHLCTIEAANGSMKLCPFLVGKQHET
jgi:hypothetical protein